MTTLSHPQIADPASDLLASIDGVTVTRRRAQTAGSGRSPSGRIQVVEPPSPESVAEIVTVAGANRIGLTPRSSTGDARFGRSNPRKGAFAIDLSGLDRVLRLDARERVVILEPGVSYRTLDGMLQEEGLRVNHPLLPPSGKSVLASVLDREPPLIPKYHWDFTDPLLCCEVIFGTGDMFRTGSAAWSKSLEAQWEAGMFQKNPLGPAQTDLAKIVQGAQGSMGIAVWASVRLERRPEIQRLFTARSQDLRQLAGLIADMTRRRLGDEIVIADRPMLSALGKALKASPPPGSQRWTLLSVVGSLPVRPEQSVACQVDELRDLARHHGLILDEVAIGEPEDFATRAFGVWGEPGFWKHHIAGASSEISFITTIDRAGPLAGTAVDTWRAVGVDPEMVATMIQPIDQGRCCHVEITAFGDPDGAGVVESSLADLAEVLARDGAFFSRPHGAVAAAAYRRCPDTVGALRTVKSILDPAGVLSPGALWADTAGDPNPVTSGRER